MSAKNGVLARISEEREQAMASLDTSRKRLLSTIGKQPTLDDLEEALAAVLHKHANCDCEPCVRATTLLSVAGKTATG
jgi:hypothetical protein